MRAAVQRFRPVILTTVVTIVGLLPLMFQLHPNFRAGVIEYKAPGSEWWVQLSGAVVWGLSFSTLLTLVLTPVLLAAPMSTARRVHWLMNVVRKRLGYPVKPAREEVRPVPIAAE